MSKKFNIPLVFLGSYFSRKWILHKAWDKFEIPKPFSKAVLYVSAPLVVTSENIEYDELSNSKATSNTKSNVIVKELNSKLDAQINAAINNAEQQAKLICLDNNGSSIDMDTAIK